MTAGLHPLIREDAERRAERGASAIVDRFGALVERLRERLPAENLDRPVGVVQVPDGVTPMRTYLATRIVETVVHTDDLAVSLGISSPPPPPEAASIAMGVFVELARARSGDIEVIRAFSRRERADPEALRVL